MAVMSVTETQVVPGSSGNVTIEQMTSAEALAVGMWVYKDSNGKAALADNSSSAKAAVYGVTVSASEAANQKVSVQRNRSLTLGAGAAPVVATPYFLSGTGGKACLAADLSAGEYVTFLGFGAAENAFDIDIVASGYAVPAA